jgi:hypothetical protein
MVLQRLRISVDCPELDALLAERRDGQEGGRTGRPEMGGISVGVQNRSKTRSGGRPDKEQKQWWVGSVAAWTEQMYNFQVTLTDKPLEIMRLTALPPPPPAQGWG